jgi:hypothetical protein
MLKVNSIISVQRSKIPLMTRCGIASIDGSEKCIPTTASGCIQRGYNGFPVESRGKFSLRSLGRMERTAPF